MPRLVLAVLALGVLTAGVVAAGPALAAPPDRATPLQKRLLSGTAVEALEAPAARVAPGLQALATVGPTDEDGCPENRGSNVRVNQDCQNLTDPDLLGRGEAQNETTVAQDPNDARRLVASSNDYLRGDSNCVTHYSRDGGRSWRDSTPPTGFTRGTAFSGFPRKYWQAAGDPAVGWDTRGNAYLVCLFFDRGPGISQNPDASSAFYVFRSTATGGGSWNFPGRPVAEFSDPLGNAGVLLDKELMAIDDERRSPFRDRIYVSWTRFDFNTGTAFIYLAYSSDYGESFSAPRLVSGNSALCGGACSVNQFSQPFTGPDGTLYVTWANFNTTPASPGDNRAQMLLARSTDGGDTFSAPVKVGDFFDLPDCLTYQGQSPGSGCVPEKGSTANSFFRAANYPVGAVDPKDDDEVVVTFGSYINRHSRESNGCVPQGFNPATAQPLYSGVKTAGACNNDIVVSRSTNGGSSFTGGTTDVRRLPSARDDDPRADQWWQWAAFTDNGRLAVSYYDRAYGNDELTGFSDVSLSGSRNASDFATVRVTSSSMPPPTQFLGAFFGDYSGLTADDVAHPVWMDTRDVGLIACRDSAGNVTLPPRVCTATAANASVANDQNIYTRSLGVPLP
jgi:hypothetical protein